LDLNGDGLGDGLAVNDEFEVVVERFEFIPPGAIVARYNLTAAAVGGNGSVLPTGGSYGDGTVVTLHATADVGYQVKQWTGTDDNGSSAATNRVTMTAHRTATVQFERIPVQAQYILTTNVIGGNGTITPVGGSHPAGALIVLTAAADPGYHLKAWTGTDNDGSTNPTNTVTMTSNKPVAAEFAKDTAAPAPPPGCTLPAVVIILAIYLATFVLSPVRPQVGRPGASKRRR